MSIRHSLIRTATDMTAVECEPCLHGQACFFTARSPGKDTGNEDSLALIPCSQDCGILVIADGLGGLRAGDLASAMLVETLASGIQGCSDNCDQLRELILDGIEQAHKNISTSLSGAATTVAVVQITGNALRPYHAGDSATLVVGQRGKIKYQSTPHSPVGYAVESGILEEDDAIFHEERHLISNAIGIDPMHIEIGPVITLAKFDTVLIASDGIYDNLQINEIVELIRKGNLQHAANRLYQQCQQRMESATEDAPHKPDDMSFILYRKHR